MAKSCSFLLLCLLVFVLLTAPTHAFGAGNIASIAKIEGKNWRHGDIEDVLKTVAHLRGYKWTSMMIKRVYFGNWLRDYSQAVDVGTLKGVKSDAIRLLVWILAFMSFGYATSEFEVTSERLGVYRPEEHIDNPEDYADNIDARQYDSRLRPPVRPEELAIDPETGMKNYIANERGDWATSAGYVRFSFARSIHFGRVFTSGASGARGKEADLFEALRCLGQGLHCMEDFGAHTNYCELALRELGFNNVFPHTGTATQIPLQGRQVFPLVTGTFGGVDFLHSVLGEATDHATQSEVDQANKALQDAAASSARGSSGLTSLLSQVPGTRDLCREAEDLQRASDAQASHNEKTGLGAPSSFAPPPGSNYPGPPSSDPPTYESGLPPPPPMASHPGHQQQPGGQAPSFPGPPSSKPGYNAQGQGQTPSFPPPPSSPYNPQSGSSGQGQAPSFPPPPQNPYNPQSGASGPQQGIPQGNNFPPPPNSQVGAQASQDHGSDESVAASQIDVDATIKKIYPILAFRDKVMRSIAEIVEKIPGLESLINTISEKITMFILGLLAPYMVPIINAVTKQLKAGSSTVVDASAKHQFGPWVDPMCTAPTHSLLSKDHFSNILNEPAGRVAATVLQYVAPRVVYAWENPGVPVEQVLGDIVRVFHHPSRRDPQCELHQNMFAAMQRWVDALPDRGARLNQVLSAESVRAGGNLQGPPDSGQGSQGAFSTGGMGAGAGIPGLGNIQSLGSKFFGGKGGSSSSPFGMFGGGTGREIEGDDEGLAYGAGGDQTRYYDHEPAGGHYSHEEAPTYEHAPRYDDGYAAGQYGGQQQGGYDPYGTGQSYSQPPSDPYGQYSNRW